VFDSISQRYFVANPIVYDILFGEEACNRDIGEHNNRIPLHPLIHKTLILTTAGLAITVLFFNELTVWWTRDF
jgi:hypothetical protein